MKGVRVRLGLAEGHLLQNVPVELLLSVAQELPNHLPAQALPLQQEVGDAHRGVRDKVPVDQILDPLLWLPGDTAGGGRRKRGRQQGSEERQSRGQEEGRHFTSVITSLLLLPRD